MSADRSETSAAGRFRNKVTDSFSQSWGDSFDVKYVHAGVPDGCHESSPVTWFYLSGHLRTFAKNAVNLRSFLDGSE